MMGQGIRREAAVGYVLRESDMVRLYNTVCPTQVFTEFETGVSN